MIFIVKTYAGIERVICSCRIVNLNGNRLVGVGDRQFVELQVVVGHQRCNRRPGIVWGIGCNTINSVEVFAIRPCHVTVVWTEVREPEVAIGVTIPSPIDVEIVVLVVSVADEHMGGSTLGGTPAGYDDRPIVQQLIVEGVLVVVDGTFVQVQNTGILVLEEFQRLGDSVQIHWCGMGQIVGLERLTHISHQGGNSLALSGIALLKTIVVEHVCPVKRRALEGFHGEFACVGDISFYSTA